MCRQRSSPAECVWQSVGQRKRGRAWRSRRASAERHGDAAESIKATSSGDESIEQLHKQGHAAGGENKNK